MLLSWTLIMVLFNLFDTIQSTLIDYTLLNNSPTIDTNYDFVLQIESD